VGQKEEDAPIITDNVHPEYNIAEHNQGLPSYNNAPLYPEVDNDPEELSDHDFHA
jgi:hypothetical protein